MQETTSRIITPGIIPQLSRNRRIKGVLPKGGIFNQSLQFEIFRSYQKREKIVVHWGLVTKRDFHSSVHAVYIEEGVLEAAVTCQALDKVLYEHVYLGRDGIRQTLLERVL